MTKLRFEKPKGRRIKSYDNLWFSIKPSFDNDKNIRLWWDEDSARWLFQEKIPEKHGYLSTDYDGIERKYVNNKIVKLHPKERTKYCRSAKAFRRLLRKWSKYLPPGIEFMMVSRWDDWTIYGKTINRRNKKYRKCPCCNDGVAKKCAISYDTKCGEELFDNTSDDQITDAIRKKFGLLFPAKIKSLMRKNKISVLDLAEKIDTTPEMVDDWLNNIKLQSDTMDHKMRKLIFRTG